MSADLRSLPGVEALLQTQQAANLVAEYGRPLTLEAIRAELADLRRRLKESEELTIPERGQILDSVSGRLEGWLRNTLIPVINATGVVLHTNLGRAPLSRAAMSAAQSLATGYCTLEYDLAKGARGSRSVHAEELLKRLTGAEAALVVNNNAAALLLCLSALARRQRVVIARSQLVEIGGGFRVPDVMNQSGAKLVEVGTTNRVNRSDFEEALAEPAALVLRTHHSNFRIQGFTAEPSLEELVEVAHARGVPLLDDLGSGALLNTEQYGLAHEPMVQESMKAGADLICFSGDKLLGGPQAGIIIGKADLVAKVKKHPLARAVRVDKLALGVLAVTLMHYLKDEAEREIPIWRMIGTTAEQIEARAQRWRAVLGMGEVIEARSTVGGGSLPEETLRTFVLALNVPQPNKFMAKLRAANPPVIARVENGQVVFDPRTVLPEEEGALLVALKNILGKL